MDKSVINKHQRNNYGNLLKTIKDTELEILIHQRAN